VSSDERSTKSAERCHLHPTRPAVARCDVCGLSLCLRCAVPVRGRVIGSDCLPEVLGPDAPTGVSATREPGAVERAIAGVAFVVALAATTLPWSRFGVGSGVFGAWGRTPRWALVAAVASALGCVVWLVRLLVRPADGRWWDLGLSVLGGLVVLGAVLAIARPPAFTRTWLGPWIAIPAGAAACLASVAALRRSRAPAPARI
jgi:hypothetical protein